MTQHTFDREIEDTLRSLKALEQKISASGQQDAPAQALLAELSAALDRYYGATGDAARQPAEQLVAELAHERDILQGMMESTDTMLAYLDCQFNFVMANSAYIRGSGHTREELIGHNHFDLFPNAENQAIFEKVRDTGEPVEFHAKPFTYTDQPERGVTYWDWTLGPVRDASGHIQGLAFALLDVTEDIRHAEERQRLLQEVAAQQAVIAERERLSRELHDGLAQTLSYIRFRLRSVRDLLDAGRSPEARQGLFELEEAARSINVEVRETILALRASSAVADTGLVASLVDYLSHFERLFGIKTDLIIEHNAPTEFTPVPEMQILAIIQEAMINIRKHAQTSEAIVRFSRTDEETIIAIADRGRGFDAGSIAAGHYGLSIMRERAKLIKARLQIVSEPGQGTTVIVRLPLDSEKRPL